MSWLDDLRPASFRGVPFKVDSSQYTGGRRITFHEFPNRDNPYPEDLGKVGKTFKVEGYLLGDDVAEQKRQMIAATDALGAAELVHPYFGILQVKVGAFSIDERRGEGRIAYISFQFYEAGDNRFPVDAEDKTEVLNAAADAGLAAAKADFDNKFSVSNLPGFAVDSARSMVEQAADAFESATKGLQQQSEEISALAFSIRNLKAEAIDLVQSPSALSSRLQASFGLLNNALGGGKSSYQAAQTLGTFASVIDSSPYQTPTRIQEKSNKDNFDNFMKRTAVLNAVKNSIDVDFGSIDETIAAREELQATLEEQILNTDNDEVYQTLTSVKAQLVRALPDKDAQTPNVQKYKLKNTTPSIVLSYDLFENAESEAEILKRNRISNPAFLPGGVELEVLNAVNS